MSSINNGPCSLIWVHKRSWMDSSRENLLASVIVDATDRGRLRPYFA